MSVLDTAAYLPSRIWTGPALIDSERPARVIPGRLHVLGARKSDVSTVAAGAGSDFEELPSAAGRLRLRGGLLLDEIVQQVGGQIVGSRAHAELLCLNFAVTSLASAR